MKFDTRCVQGAYNPKNGDPRVLPLYQSTTFAYDTPEQLAEIFNLNDSGYMYTRLGNPTTDCLAEKIALLEGGVAGLATSSGQAATTLAITNVCEQGDNIIALSKIYGGTFNLFNVTLRKLGIETRFIDPDTSAQEIEKLIDDKTKAIFGETIANPGMTVLDFDKYAKIAQKYKLLFMVDNTLATPYLVKPLEHGANIVLHSTTKYMDGHACSLGGMVVEDGKFEFKNNPRYPQFNTPDDSYHGLVYANVENGPFCLKGRAQILRDLGATMSPFNAYLTNLGSETLHLRMQKHSDNALACAKALQANPNVEWVKYPGLESDSQHEIAQKYFKNGFGGMLTFGVKGGREKTNEFMKKLKLIKIVTHIADVRSCVLHPATTTHRQLSDQQLIASGISDNLVRFSVGIEDCQDLLDDLLNALK